MHNVCERDHSSVVLHIPQTLLGEEGIALHTTSFDFSRALLSLYFVSTFYLPSLSLSLGAIKISNASNQTHTGTQDRERERA